MLNPEAGSSKCTSEVNLEIIENCIKNKDEYFYITYYLIFTIKIKI